MTTRQASAIANSNEFFNLDTTTQFAMSSNSPISDTMTMFSSIANSVEHKGWYSRTIFLQGRGYHSKYIWLNITLKFTFPARENKKSAQCNATDKSFWSWWWSILANMKKESRVLFLLYPSRGILSWYTKVILEIKGSAHYRYKGYFFTIKILKRSPPIWPTPMFNA